MENFLTFINEHIFLAVLFVVTVIMLVVEEMKPKGSLEAADVAILIQKGGLIFDLQASTESKSQLKNSRCVTDYQKFSWDKHKDKKLILYCKDGVISKTAASELRSKGFDAYFIAGGLQAWQKDGFEVIPKEGQ